MPGRGSIAAIAVTAALCASIAPALAFDDAKYPDWKGQWSRAPVPGVSGNPSYDPSKPRGRGEQAPLTAEYQAIFEANLVDQAEGGQGTDATFNCLATGMPRTMMFVWPDGDRDHARRHLHPDRVHSRQPSHLHRRARLAREVEPAFEGYSIGRWIDQDGDGRYGALEIETRGPFKGPRAYDASGLPLHADNQTIVKERIYLDKTNRGLLHDEVTTIDHALTRPWTVTQNYRRSPSPQPFWREYVCAENNSHVQVGNETYYLSADGLLMPAKKDQAPPDLRYFGATPK